MGNFVECIRSRRDPVAPVEAVHAATTATLIADIATRGLGPATDLGLAIGTILE